MGFQRLTRGKGLIGNGFNPTVRRIKITTTPTGTTVIGVNMNARFSSTVPDAVAAFDEEALAQGSVIFDVWTPITDTFVLETDGVILGKNQYIQVDQVTESTTGSITIVGHYATPS